MADVGIKNLRFAGACIVVMVFIFCQIFYFGGPNERVDGFLTVFGPIGSPILMYYFVVEKNVVKKETIKKSTTSQPITYGEIWTARITIMVLVAIGFFIMLGQYFMEIIPNIQVNFFYSLMSTIFGFIFPSKE